MLPKSVQAVAGLLLLSLALGAAPAQAAKHYLGGGVRYFKTLDDVEIDEVGKIDTDGNSLILSYQADPVGLFKFELDLEYFADGFGDLTGDVLSPQFLVLVGSTLYGGVGAGIYYIPDNLVGDDTSDVFYVGRLGLQLTVLPRLHIDLNANYQTDVFDKLFDGAGSDSITLGAMARVRIK
ncbi:MAG: hypothetical protein O7A04_05330 [Acidobacteria bacterium]|nr:hypothetical protein [Acidobacteriota bacterium]